MFNFSDFIQVFVFTKNHHLKSSNMQTSDFLHNHHIKNFNVKLQHFANADTNTDTHTWASAIALPCNFLYSGELKTQKFTEQSLAVYTPKSNIYVQLLLVSGETKRK